MMTSDFHMHTEFSTDSDTPVREMIEGAIRKGLKKICITDHYDQDYPYYEELGKDAFTFDLEQYFKKLTPLKEEYAGRIDVRIGVEIGLQPHLGEFYKKFANAYPFDFIIGSVHLVHGTDPYYQEIFQNKTDEEAYRETFIETLENIKAVDDFDVLGHMDYICRYGRHKSREYSYARFSDEIDAILKTLIEKGKGIEMNMSGFKYGLGFCHPHPDVLKRYRQLGGEIITVGADGHCPEHIAYDFDKVSEILKSCGFSYYTEFQERKPIFQQLP